MRYLAGILITLLLTIPAIWVELFRYRGAANDGGTLEYAFEAGEQNSPNAVTKEKVAEIAVENLFAGKCAARPDSSNLGRHRRWQVRFFVLFFVSLWDFKISWNKSSFLTIGAILFFVLIPLVCFWWIHAGYSICEQALTPQVINSAGGHRQFLVFKPKCAAAGEVIAWAYIDATVTIL